MTVRTSANKTRSASANARAGQRIEWHQYSFGNHRSACPGCGRGDRDKTLGLTIGRDNAGVAHCFRCGYIEVSHTESGSKHKRAQKLASAQKGPKYETLSDYGLKLFAQTEPLHGVALEYLEARQCVIPPSDADLRFHPNLKHPNGYVGPALVALVTDAITARPISLHRTWIQSNGTKANVEPPRLLLSGHRKTGGVIRLWPDENVTLGLGIAEGIETSLSLAHAFTPVWSLLDAGNLAIFPVLPGIESLTIAADNDPVGNKAAKECATRWTIAGNQVRVVIPPTQCDLNDLARGPHEC